MTMKAALFSGGHDIRLAQVPDPVLPEQIADSCGRGLFLIRKLVDEVHFNEQGNSICMTLRRR